MPLSLRVTFLSVLFGMAIILMDFSDSYPLFGQVGNLDHLLGHRFWHPLEIIYPLALIVIFLLYGKVSLDLGMKESVRGATKTQNVSSFVTLVKIILPFLLFALLLVMIDIDDILNVLGVSSALIVSSHSAYYWAPLELAIFPLGSLSAYIVFGKMCFDAGKRTFTG